MGKDLKGKELGTGITQRKNGRYYARFIDKNKNRIAKHFDKISDAKKWLIEAKYNDEHGNIAYGTNMTVNTWFEYWINNIKTNTVRKSTLNHYLDRYNYNIKEFIGNMIISDVKPMHCQNIINNMVSKGYAVSSMTQTRITLFSMFSSAVENEIILKNPVSKSVKCPKSKKNDVRVLTIEEQELFLEVAKTSSYYRQYQFILQTGLRIGELIGLKWEDVNFDSRTISIQRSVKFHTQDNFAISPPKSMSGYRTIPLTDLAYNILIDIKKERKKEKVINIDFKDYIFLNKQGRPTTNIVYNNNLRKLCKRANIEKISVHTLRHTFATRCIEADMRPKTLQGILGHSNISVTMDLYVHITEESKENEMKKFQNYFKVV